MKKNSISRIGWQAPILGIFVALISTTSVFAASANFYNPTLSSNNGQPAAVDCESGDFKLDPKLVKTGTGGGMSFNCVKIPNGSVALGTNTLMPATGCPTGYGGIDAKGFGKHCLSNNLTDAMYTGGTATLTASSTGKSADTLGREACEASGGVWGDHSETGGQGNSCGDCPAGKTSNASICSAPNTNETPSGVGPELEVTGEASKIIEYLQKGIDLLTAIAGVIIAAMVVVGGIQYSTAGGNPQAAAGAKKKITNAVIAMLALTFLYTFLQWLVPGGVFS